MAMHAFTQETDSWSEETLPRAIEQTIPDAFACARAICNYLTEQSGHAVSATARACLAMCIRRACH